MVNTRIEENNIFKSSWVFNYTKTIWTDDNLCWSIFFSFFSLGLLQAPLLSGYPGLTSWYFCVGNYTVFSLRLWGCIIWGPFHNSSYGGNGTICHNNWRLLLFDIWMYWGRSIRFGTSVETGAIISFEAYTCRCVMTGIGPICPMMDAASPGTILSPGAAGT